MTGKDAPNPSQANAAATLDHLLHGLHDFLHDGGTAMSDETRAALETLYLGAVRSLGSGFVPELASSMPRARAIAYALDGDAQIQEVPRQDGPPRWAIRDQFSRCMNTSGEWEDEPRPSSRDDAFFARCRWDSVDEAFVAWISSHTPGSNIKPGR